MRQISCHDVTSLIRDRLGRNLSADVALDENSVLDELGMSSIESWDVIFALEERMDIEFDTDEAAAVRTVGQLVALCQKASSA
jgi:acyl carrier protein